jgi:RNA recognition motif-containing protein
MMGMDTGSNGGEVSLSGGSEVDARKLVILGLPWDTTEGSLERYFSQIGPLQVRPVAACGAPTTKTSSNACARHAGPHICL